MVIHHPDGTLTVDHENYAGRVFKDQAELTAAVIDDLQFLIELTQAQVDRLAPSIIPSRPVKLPVITTFDKSGDIEKAIVRLKHTVYLTTALCAISAS